MTNPIQTVFAMKCFIQTVFTFVPVQVRVALNAELIAHGELFAVRINLLGAGSQVACFIRDAFSAYARRVQPMACAWHGFNGDHVIITFSCDEFMTSNSTKEICRADACARLLEGFAAHCPERIVETIQASGMNDPLAKPLSTATPEERAARRAFLQD